MIEMTCSNSSSSTTLRRAAILFLPGGGKTPCIRGNILFKSYPGFLRRWPIGNFRGIALPQTQVRVRQHHQGHMTVESRPQAAFIMIKPKFSFGVLIESFDDPTDMCEVDKILQGKLD